MIVCKCFYDYKFVSKYHHGVPTHTPYAYTVNITEAESLEKKIFAKIIIKRTHCKSTGLH